jgi:hypothetical protein
MTDISFSDCTIHGAEVAFYAHVGLISPDRPKYAGHSLTPGSLTGLRFQRISGSVSSPVACSITAAPDASPISDVTLTDIDLHVPGDPSTWSSSVDDPSHISHAHAFGQDLPAKGVYLRRVHGLTVNSCRFLARNADPRPDVVVD